MLRATNETLFDVDELLNDMRAKVKYWNDVYREKVEAPEKVMRNNCRVALMACIIVIEEELDEYKAKRGVTE